MGNNKLVTEEDGAMTGAATAGDGSMATSVSDSRTTSKKTGKASINPAKFAVNKRTNHRKNKKRKKKVVKPTTTKLAARGWTGGNIITESLDKSAYQRYVELLKLPQYQQKYKETYQNFFKSFDGQPFADVSKRGDRLTLSLNKSESVSDVETVINQINNMLSQDEMTAWTRGKKFQFQSEDDFIAGKVTNVDDGRQMGVNKVFSMVMKGMEKANAIGKDYLVVKNVVDFIANYDARASNNKAVATKSDNPLQDTGSVLDNYDIVFSHHFYDLAGQSTDKYWRSCMYIANDRENGSSKDGIYAKYVLTDIVEGSLVAYLVDNRGVNMGDRTGETTQNMPAQATVARVSIKQFTNIDNESQFMLAQIPKVYSIDKQGYGGEGDILKTDVAREYFDAIGEKDSWSDKVPQKVITKFKEVVQSFCDKFNTTVAKIQVGSTSYHLKDGMYDDGLSKTTMKAEADDITLNNGVHLFTKLQEISKHVAEKVRENSELGKHLFAISSDNDVADVRTLMNRGMVSTNQEYEFSDLMSTINSRMGDMFKESRYTNTNEVSTEFRRIANAIVQYCVQSEDVNFIEVLMKSKHVDSVWKYHVALGFKHVQDNVTEKTKAFMEYSMLGNNFKHGSGVVDSVDEVYQQTARSELVLNPYTYGNIGGATAQIETLFETLSDEDKILIHSGVSAYKQLFKLTHMFELDNSNFLDAIMTKIREEQKDVVNAIRMVAKLTKHIPTEYDKIVEYINQSDIVDMKVKIPAEVLRGAIKHSDGHEGGQQAKYFDKAIERFAHVNEALEAFDKVVEYIDNVKDSKAHQLLMGAISQFDEGEDFITQQIPNLKKIMEEFNKFVGGKEVKHTLTKLVKNEANERTKDIELHAKESDTILKAMYKLIPDILTTRSEMIADGNYQMLNTIVKLIIANLAHIPTVDTVGEDGDVDMMSLLMGTPDVDIYKARGVDISNGVDGLRYFSGMTDDAGDKRIGEAQEDYYKHFQNAIDEYLVAKVKEGTVDDEYALCVLELYQRATGKV